MCGGPSQQELDVEAAQAKFYNMMTQQYQVVFGKQQAILDELTAVFEPILKAGPDQPGFGPNETNAIETQIVEGNAKNFAQGERQLNENLAARGGSDFIPSGVDLQLREGLSAAASALKSESETQATIANYEEGRKQWETAAEVLGGVASQQNPVGFANATSAAGADAAKTAMDITQAENSGWQAVLGAVAGVGGEALGGWLSKPAG